MSMKPVIIGSNATAKAAVAAAGGVVSINLSPFVCIAVVPSSFDATSLALGSSVFVADEEVNLAVEWLENTTDILQDAWTQLESMSVEKTERAIPLSKTGKIGLSILTVSGEQDQHQFSYENLSDLIAQIFSGLLSLSYSYPAQKLVFDYVNHNVTIEPSTQVAHVGNTKWPSPVPFQDKLYCFFQGNRFNQKKLRYVAYDPTTSAWGLPTTVADVTVTEGPSAVAFNDKLYVFHNGHSSRHEVWFTVFDGSSWVPDARIPNTRITGGPSAIVHDDKLYVFHQGYTENDNELWYNVTSDGSTWEGDRIVSDTLITGSPSAITFKDSIYCFYQGVAELEQKLLVNRFNPTTCEWSGHVEVPYTGTISEVPSAVTFDDKIYLFHQYGSSGELWFNTSSDGILWKGDTPLTHAVSTDGLGTTVFEDKLFIFYQGAGTQLQSLYYRSFSAGSFGWEDLWVEPALEKLGFSSGYQGFQELAAEAKSSTEADYGFVITATKLPLLYSSYGDGTRLFIEYPSTNIDNAIAQVFDATGSYDTAAHSTRKTPRYTFAHRSALDNTLPISLYSTAFLFHQAKVGTSGKQLWFSLLDRRTNNWAEMQGPVTSATIGGQGTVFLVDSKIYLFYAVTTDNAIYYNVLDGATWTGETKVPLDGITVAAGAGPSSIFYKEKIHVFYPVNGTTFAFITLNTSTNTWTKPVELDLEVNETGKNPYDIGITPNITSPVIFLNNVCNLYNGKIKATTDTVYLEGRVRINVFNGKATKSDMQVPDTYLTAKPGAAVYKNKIYCFHQGSKSDGTIWYNTSADGSNWAGDKKLTLENSLAISRGPSCMVLGGLLYCFFNGKTTTDATKVWYNIWNGSTWAGQLILPTGSGVSAQHNALAIGSLSIAWENYPPTIARVI